MEDNTGKYRGLTKNVFLDKLRTDGKGTRRRVYGYYCKIQSKHYIILEGAELGMIECTINFGIIGFVEVDPETVGQCTGQLDKNGKEIYGSIPMNGKMSKGGDIYKWEDDEIGYIEWDEHTSGFCRRRKQNPCVPYALHSDTVQDIEVIGNIHEKPELLEKG